MYIKYVISATDPNISVSLLAKWVRKALYNEPNSIAKALMIARTMVFGESWSPDMYLESLVPPPPDTVVVTKVEVLEEHDIRRAEHLAKIKSQKNLLQRAVAGDAEAAIEYCKLAAAGKIIHEYNSAFA